MGNIKKFFKSPWPWAFLFGIFCIHLVQLYSQARLSAPPPWVVVGPWSLVDSQSKAFGSEDLKGKVVIASFFFTRCPTVCPKLMQAMQEERKRFLNLLDQVAFVSISIDPEYDSAQALEAYRHQHDFDWTFLTGSMEQVQHVIEGQMKFGLGAEHHVAELILLDQNGDVRGKFGTDPAGLASLEKAAKFLVSHPL